MTASTSWYESVTGLTPEQQASMGVKPPTDSEPAPQAHPRSDKPPTGRLAASVPLPKRQDGPPQENLRRPESRNLVDSLPANTDAEKGILGAVLLDNHAHAEAVVAGLIATEFSLDSNQRIWRHMTAMLNAQRGVDIVTLADELTRYKEVEAVGGVAYLASLTEGLPRQPRVGEYCRIVKERSTARAGLAIAAKLTSRLQGRSGTSGETLTWAADQFAALADAGGLNSFNSFISLDGEEWPVLADPALHGLAGDVVRAVEPHSEADPAAVLMQFLAAFGNVIGAGSHCLVEASRHGLNLFAVLVGETSKARKGTSWGHIRRLFERVDSGWTSNRVTGGLSSAEGLISEVRDEVDVPTDKRLMVVQDEFASVLRIMSREGNNLSPVLRSAWDCGTLRTLVKHDPLKATGAHISMVGHITRPELLKYLSETESHNGFANRLLWICVKRSKCLPEGGMVPLQTLTELSDRIGSSVEWARIEAREFRRNEEARKLWAAVYPKLSEGKPGLLGAATGRAEAQVLRLSAVYAALDCSSVVRVEHLRAALAIWDYTFASARYIFGDATGNVVADRIREALEFAGAEGLTRTGLSELFKRNVSGDRIGQALAQLASLGLAQVSRRPTEGRSIEVWCSTKETKETKEGGRG